MSSLAELFPLQPGASTAAQGVLSYVDGGSSMSNESRRAYALYSLCYPPLALLAYKLVWRGKLLRHIAYFRASAEASGYLVDIATGDGTLTKKALFPLWGGKVQALLVLDISKDMLAKALKKLPSDRTLFVQGDVMAPPFRQSSLRHITCFGGFNSFASGAEAMQRIAAVLAPGGVMRGSVLLTPKRAWRRKAVDLFIRWGLQTEHVDFHQFVNWVQGAGLRLVEAIRYGDVLLFEVAK
ncbi:MAG: class I SAM-dependent methyltransferase [Chlamydiia bacterium]|nr:class I SAM-dependent methyltransferase [Chlamydiia bacterium]